MADLENGCEWHFGPEGPLDLGPTNPSKGSFKSTPEINVVREAIQNSLDARPKGGTLPVRVSFCLSRMSRADFPNFFALSDHIDGVLNYYPTIKRAQEKFPRMKKAMEVDEIPLLSIKDYATTGMEYKSGLTECAFYAFAQSIGVSAAKGEGSGGSNGLGKNTLFEFSSVRSILVSTRTADGNVAFQGKTELATHLNSDGDRISKFGFYGHDVREPVTEESIIPVPFHRSETGTDIHIVGVDDSNPDALRNDIVRAVLNHFWMSVRAGLLEVDVLGCEISKRTLAERMKEYFPSENDSEGSSVNYVKWTPVPYWRAVENAECGLPKTVLVQENLPTLGDVELYLDWSTSELPGRIVYMRKPLMAIFKKRKTSYPPFAAVFACRSDIGNDLLKDCEPPDHGSWDATNYEGEDTALRRRAVHEALNFVNAMLDKYLRGEATRNEIIIPGLAELLPDVNERAAGGEHGTVGSGASDGLQPSGDLSPKETAAPVSFIDPATGKPVDLEERENSGSINGLVEDSAPAENGQQEMTFADDNLGKPNPSPAHGPQETGTPVADNVATESEGAMHLLVHVSTRIGTRRDENGRLWHKVFIRPAPEEIPARCASVKLSIQSGSDNGKFENPSIEAVSGIPDGALDQVNGQINGIDIRGGTTFDILFRDKFPHSVKVVAHATLR